MRRKVHVTPGGMSVMQAWIGIVFAASMLVFGIVFAAVVLGESPASEVGLRVLMVLFFALFAGVCIAIMVASARVLSARASPEDRSVFNLEAGAPGPEGSEGPVPEGDFESRLRKLEALRRDGLLTEAEYLGKRARILGERW